MNDCLVTKLKGVVNNDNLEVLGELKIVTVDSGVIEIGIKPFASGESWTITSDNTEDDLTIASMSIGAEKTLTNPVDYQAPWTIRGTVTKKTTFRIANAIYNNKALNLKGVGKCNQLSKIPYVSDFERVNIITPMDENPNINLADFVNTNTLDQLTVWASGVVALREYVYGNINSLANKSNLTYLSLGQNQRISGSIDSLAASVNIGTIQLQGTAIGGTIENLVRAQCNNGRVEGTLLMDIKNSAITFQGNPIVDVAPSGWFKLVYTSTGCVAKDNDDNVISTYDKANDVWS